MKKTAEHNDLEGSVALQASFKACIEELKAISTKLSIKLSLAQGGEGSEEGTLPPEITEFNSVIEKLGKLFQQHIESSSLSAPPIPPPPPHIPFENDPTAFENAARHFIGEQGNSGPPLNFRDKTQAAIMLREEESDESWNLAQAAKRETQQVLISAQGLLDTLKNNQLVEDAEGAKEVLGKLSEIIEKYHDLASREVLSKDIIKLRKEKHVSNRKIRTLTDNLRDRITEVQIARTAQNSVFPVSGKL